jgi:aminotransferase
MANVDVLKTRFNTPVSKMEMSLIRQVDEKVTPIPGIIKLTLGAPDFNTPEHVKQAAITAIEENFSHYSSNTGFLSTREAACNFVNKKYNLDFNPENECVITVGATEAVANTMMACLNPGDTVIIPDPAFGLYEGVANMVGANVVMVDTSNTNFLLMPESIDQAMAAHPEAKMIVLNYPSNPCGTTYTPEEVKAVDETLAKYDVFVLSDEIYSELSYESDHVSVAQYIKEQTIVVTGLSKSHAMTGWRIGVTFAPEYITSRLAITHQNTTTCATSIAQKAAEEAWANGMDDAIPMKAEYQKRRDFVGAKFKELGFEVAKPKGAFYIFAKIPAQFNQNSVEFVLDLAEKARVALIPGVAFGPKGEGYVRLSYAASMENLEEAMKRIAEYVNA